MVAAQFANSILMMTPGTSSMLRARRKDVNVRPNRFLDRTASRGMIYENEELRLRTININYDLEKGQQYIKQLRRENNQLRREIWNIRDQYDKLECMLKNQEQEQVLIEEIDKNEETDQDGTESLSIVEEENEDTANEEAESQNKHTSSESAEDLEYSSNDIESILQLFPNKINLGTVTLPFNTSTKNDVTQFNAPSENEATKMCSLKKSEDFIRIFRNNTEEYHTLVFSAEEFEDLTVQEVIDELEQQLKEDCRCIVKGIRLTNKNCFITVHSPEQCELLKNAGLKIKDKLISLENIWERSTVLQLSAVPPHVLDEQIIAAISRFADIIGVVEKQTYKGFDTGERYIHVKSRESIPGKILLGSTCLDLDIIYPQQQNQNPNASSIARRKSFRSQININLIPPEDDTSSMKSENPPADSVPPELSAQKSEPPFFSKSTGVTLTPSDVDKPTSSPFQFLNNTQQSTSSASPQPHQSSMKKKSPVPSTPNKPVTDSPLSFRKFSQRRNNSGRRTADISQPPSPIPFHNSSNKLIRKSSVNFKGSGSNNVSPRHSDMYNEYGYGRERSTSDASSRQSICKRKLSVTGHEGSGKIPWCGCWGIGCC